MKRKIISLALCLALSLTLFSCGKKDDVTESEEIKYEDIELSEEDINIIKKWWDVSAYDVSYDVAVSAVSDGDTENPDGSASSFKVRKIKDGENNVYYGTYSFQSSVFPYPMSYDYYYADGMQYQIYRNPDTTEEQDYNQYEACEMTEEDFILGFDGLEIAMPTDEEFASASGKLSSTGLKTVSLISSNEKTVQTVAGAKEFYEQTAGAIEGSVKFSDIVFTFGIENGKLAGILAAFDIEYSTDEHASVHVEYDKSWTVNATDGGVEPFDLPDKSLFEAAD